MLAITRPDGKPMAIPDELERALYRLVHDAMVAGRTRSQDDAPTPESTAAFDAACATLHAAVLPALGRFVNAEMRRYYMVREGQRIYQQRTAQRRLATDLLTEAE